MKIFPAVDLYEGKVVRLTQGDYSRRRVYELSPLDAAKSFRDAGCPRIHVVDLEGAWAGEPKHLKELSAIASLGLFVQYGGGLRSAEAVARAVSAGAGRVMAGSLIFKDLGRASELSARFGDKIMAAVDIKNGKVVHSGWLAATEFSAAEAVDKLFAMGFSSFLVTQTERDGMMSGTDASVYGSLAARGRFIAAAGGVTDLHDIRALAAAGVDAAVVGKSLYEGGITLAEALDACSE
ncbi:1-(5-phosphoribosyl)-5-[(5-phosphoribosylamino)methylideneamino]imidazole-4-carboxamide isomerase [Cloacibacillus evryensis]|uniref:1-(5-phosphoribosyl)-5-[(5- phosphoribosylamino)methylideneamino]imidazole-4- carboxamide isomerase n=1 Tax=Cloacibacillus evryensis TaxID=508460 RepID=UPI002108E044|nr:HisA/HisF-related TIM barrel protein [Cloacibacillus evryensis]MCQ4764327.1 HisA/HisF-related TIM barrel protein [Cloacibacillus evryensis]